MPSVVSTELWDVVQGLAGAGAVLVSLWVLYLQRRDLAMERQRQRRSQANALMVDTRSDLVERDGGYEHLGSYIRLTNTSNRPVRVEGVTVKVPAKKSDEHWWPWGMRDMDVPLNDSHSALTLLGGESHEFRQPEGWWVEVNVGGSGFAVVQFRDSDNQRWERRTDTYELREPYYLQDPPGALRLLRRITSPLLQVGGGFVYNTLFWLSLKSVRRRPDRMPISLRIANALTGRGFEFSRGDPWDVSRADEGELFRHAILFDPGPPWFMNSNDDEHRRKWKEAFDDYKPSTWPFGHVRLRDLFRVTCLAFRPRRGKDAGR